MGAIVHSIREYGITLRHSFDAIWLLKDVLLLKTLPGYNSISHFFLQYPPEAVKLIQRIINTEDGEHA